MDNLAVNKHDLHIRRVDQEYLFMAFFSAFIYTNLKRLVKRKQMFVILRIHIENTSWKVLAYGIYARVVDVSEIERVSAANE